MLLKRRLQQLRLDLGQRARRLLELHLLLWLLLLRLGLLLLQAAGRLRLLLQPLLLVHLFHWRRVLRLQCLQTLQRHPHQRLARGASVAPASRHLRGHYGHEHLLLTMREACLLDVLPEAARVALGQEHGDHLALLLHLAIPVLARDAPEPARARIVFWRYHGRHCVLPEALVVEGVHVPGDCPAEVAALVHGRGSHGAASHVGRQRLHGLLSTVRCSHLHT
mmetsp:Transcript_97387/g.314492  ORF Transcript_97387/g.314492 Transcript_97387/m.314492 type:complete len:222 (+) Transcript_97387:1808-2473(+)